MLDVRESKVFHRRERAEAAFEVLGAEAAAAAPSLIRLLDDKDETIRASAATVLGYIGSAGQAAVPALVRHLNDVWRTIEKGGLAFDEAVSIAAEAALDAIPHAPTTEFLC